MRIGSGQCQCLQRICSAALLCLIACENRTRVGVAKVPPTDAAAEVEQAASYRLQRMNAWPGGGLQLIAAPLASLSPRKSLQPRLLRGDEELTSSTQACAGTTHCDASVTDGAVPQVESQQPAAISVSAIIFTPAADSALHNARLRAAEAIITALPSNERMGLWLGADNLPLLAEITEQRAHVLERLAAIAAEDRGQLNAEALLSLRVRLSQLGGTQAPLPATLFVVGPALHQDDEANKLHELRVDHVQEQRGGWELQASADPEPSYAAELEDSVQQLLAARARAHAGTLRVAACGDFQAGEALTLQLGTQALSVRAPPPSELNEHVCVAAEAAADAYPLADTISLELSDTELALHDRNAAENSKGDFTLRVKIPGAPSIFGTAHFRGQTSLKCERKSYSVSLGDKRRRRLFADASVSEFYLLSLCTEQGFFRQVLANRLMREMGLFPMEQRYVRLQVAGRERGVYLLLEKPEEKLRDTRLALTTVIRRRDETEGTDAEVEYPGSGAPASTALEQYLAVDALVGSTEPAQLYAALAQKLDMASYLRWLALQTIFQSGDYVDEVFFYASDESAAANGGWYFRNLGWDTDDLFTKCHNRGEKAHIDPHEIVYCAESRLDRALFVSDDVYARFASTLSELMDGPLAAERVENVLAGVRADLLAVLTDDEVCLGSLGELNGQPSTCDVLVPWVSSQIDDLLNKLYARQKLLRERLAAYEASR